MTRRALRRAATWAGRLALAAVAVGWTVFLRPMALGGPVDYLVIRGDSMLPTYVTGDLVLVRTGDRYTSGDVVAYRVPAGELGAGRIVIHRLVGQAGGSPAGGEDRLVVQGDNNPAPDPWQPRVSDIVGRAWIAIPVVGRVLSFLHQPAVLAAGAVAILVVGWVLRGARPAATPAARPLLDRPGHRARPAGTLAAWMRSRPRRRPAPPHTALSSSEADSAA